ncbi:MAG: UvrB/UvrC motif-containing protein [Bacteroidales bacterium]|nr:UvrB/UvrC motif-containing protein [Bacteroidales bacterium]
MGLFYVTDNIPLFVKGLAGNTSLSNARILVLQESAGERLFPVLLNEEEYEVLENAMMRQSYPTLEMMMRLVKTAGYKLESVKLLGARDGKQLTEMLFVNEAHDSISMSADIGNGIAAAIKTDCRLFIPRKTFEEQYRLTNSPEAMAVPLNAMPAKLLEEAMDDAVKRDDFELAKALRDELRRREGKEE